MPPVFRQLLGAAFALMVLLSDAANAQTELPSQFFPGIIGDDDIHSLGAVLTGAHPGRTSDEQITYHFNNNGTAAADMALAKIVFDRAREDGRGTEIDIPVPGMQ